MKKIKDLNYNQLHENIWSKTTKLGPTARSRYRLLTALIQKYQPRPPIIDVGCGSGELLAQINKFYPAKNLFGFDISSKAIKLAKKNFPKLNFFQGNLIKIPKKFEGKFKTIICSEVLEHLENDLAAIKNLERLSQKNSLVFVSVPSLTAHWSQLDKSVGHFRRYEPNELERKMTENGFKVIERFSWGKLLYPPYQKIIEKHLIKIISEDKKTSLENSLLQKTISNFIYNLFKLEDLLKNLDTLPGRKLFLVAQRK